MKTSNTAKLEQIFILLLFFLSTQTISAQIKSVDVESFDKVIISPYIQVVFKEGNQKVNKGIVIREAVVQKI